MSLMNKKTVLTISILLFSLSNLLAQGPNREQMPANGIISGTVVDDKGNPVEYATVSLVSMRDSSLLTGGITDSKGQFKLSELKLGVYILNIKFLGFETKEIKPIYLFPKGRGKGQGIEQQFDNIKLDNSAISIDDVNVVADKSHVQYKIDRKVVNVSQDINSASGSAVDILQNTPSVNVDIDGNVELRGSSKFTVLIDGKPTVLEASEALQQIPANLIENIEIITNPSAKFDPDGTAGIINVILQKKKSLGFNGLLNVSAGTGDKYKANATFNYKIGKFNITAGFDYRDEKRNGSGFQERETYTADTTYYLNYDGTRNMNIYGYGFKGGIDYYINDNNTLSVSGRYGKREFTRTSNSYYHEYKNPTSVDEYYLRDNNMGYDGSSYSLSLDYSLKLKKPEQKLDVSLYYSNWDGTRLDDQYKYFTDANRNILDIDPELRRGDEIGPREDYRYNLDYVSPLGENGKIEAGFQGRYEIDNEQLIYSNYNPSLNDWEIDLVKSNSVEFSRNIQAAYATYTNKLWGFDYKIALRTEYTKRILNQVNKNETYDINRFDFFPSAYITRQLNKTQQIQLNYSRRIDRPHGRELDPFPDYSDPKNIRQGNPYLDPEYADSYELNFQQQFNKSFVSIETFYRRTNNLISREPISLGADTTVWTYQNLNHDNSLGAEVNANININKWWRFNASASGYYYQIIGQVDDQDVNNETFNYDFRLNNNFSFKSNTKIQLTGFYRGPSISAQGTTDAFYFTNLAVRQDLLKGKLTITAQVQDIFNSMKHQFTTETSQLYSNSEFRREGQVYTLSLTYRLNNFKQKRNSDRNEGDVEMDMDM